MQKYYFMMITCIYSDRREVGTLARSRIFKFEFLKIWIWRDVVKMEMWRMSIERRIPRRLLTSNLMALNRFCHLPDPPSMYCPCTVCMYSTYIEYLCIMLMECDMTRNVFIMYACNIYSEYMHTCPYYDSNAKKYSGVLRALGVVYVAGSRCVCMCSPQSPFIAWNSVVLFRPCKIHSVILQKVSPSSKRGRERESSCMYKEWQCNHFYYDLQHGFS